MTPAERRDMQRLRRQRDALLDQLWSLVNLGNLGLMPGMIYAEIHRDDIRKAERLVKRMLHARATGPTDDQFLAALGPCGK